MKIIAGLGNPGARYETTRHNVGFLAVDRLVDEWKARGPVSRNQAQVYESTVRGEKVLLVKPQTYMNRSGQSVGPLFTFYKCAPGDLIVIHDEIDLPPGSLRIKTGGGSGGHNGIKSVDEHVGSANTNYHRIRIGVGRPAPGSPISPADYVLAPLTDEELKGLDPLLDRVRQAAELLVEGDASGAMNRFNVRTNGK